VEFRLCVRLDTAVVTCTKHLKLTGAFRRPSDDMEWVSLDHKHEFRSYGP
jgi:hypothetical protein